MDPAEGEGVVVRTDRGDVKCKRVAICTNGWSPRLLPELSEVLYPVRNGVIMTAPVKAWSWPGSVSIGDGPEEIYAQKRPVRRPSASDPSLRFPDLAWLITAGRADLHRRGAAARPFLLLVHQRVGGAGDAARQR